MSDTAAVRLVRVQSDFQGIAVEDDGTLSLYRYGDNIRNTMHFSVSGVVASHEMGNWEDRGVVIVADPAEISAPLSGCRLEDAWYHCGDGRKLHIGRATVLAPEGMSTPAGIPVVRYPPGGRNEAVRACLQSMGVEAVTITRNGVCGVGFDAYLDQCKALAQAYANGGPAAMSSHMGTIEEQAERCLSPGGWNSILDRCESTHYYHGTDTGVELEAPEYVLECARVFRAEIAEHLDAYPSVGRYAREYFTRVSQSLDALESRANVLADRYDKRFTLVDASGRVAYTNQTWESAAAIAMTLGAENFAVVDNWPYRGEATRNLGPADEVFEQDIRAARRRTSIPIDEDFQGFPCTLPPRCTGAALDAFREARMAGRADSRHDDTQFSTLPRMRG